MLKFVYTPQFHFTDADKIISYLWLSDGIETNFLNFYEENSYFWESLAKLNIKARNVNYIVDGMCGIKNETTFQGYLVTDISLMDLTETLQQQYNSWVTVWESGLESVYSFKNCVEPLVLESV